VALRLDVPAAFVAAAGEVAEVEARLLRRFAGGGLFGVICERGERRIRAFSCCALSLYFSYFVNRVGPYFSLVSLANCSLLTFLQVSRGVNIFGHTSIFDTLRLHSAVRHASTLN